MKPNSDRVQLALDRPSNEDEHREPIENARLNKYSERYRAQRPLTEGKLCVKIWTADRRLQTERADGIAWEGEGRDGRAELEFSCANAGSRIRFTRLPRSMTLYAV